MAGPVWIKGKALDGRHTQDFEHHPKFVGYLVHLGAPACTIVVGRFGLSQETKIKCDPDAGFYYRKGTSDLDLVIQEWHGQPPSSEKVISNLLYEAASHLLVEHISALEREAVEV
jgi:hypothetical protein